MREWRCFWSSPGNTNDNLPRRWSRESCFDLSGPRCAEVSVHRRIDYHFHHQAVSVCRGNSCHSASLVRVVDTSRQSLLSVEEGAFLPFHLLLRGDIRLETIDRSHHVWMYDVVDTSRASFGLEWCLPHFCFSEPIFSSSFVHSWIPSLGLWKISILYIFGLHRPTEFPALILILLVWVSFIRATEEVIGGRDDIDHLYFLRVL